MYRIEDPLQEVPLRALRPTQMTAGFKEVQAKRRQWAKLGHRKCKAAMAEVLFPVVAGPKGAYFILDHHHIAVALLREGARKVQIGLVRDLSRLDTTAFWIYLDHETWVHPYDRKGRRRTFREIPPSLAGLRDDPYRTLAGAVQDNGGFAKSDTPFLEFLWSNHFPHQHSRRPGEVALSQGGTTCGSAGAHTRRPALARLDRASQAMNRDIP